LPAACCLLICSLLVNCLLLGTLAPFSLLRFLCCLCLHNNTVQIIIVRCYLGRSDLYEHHALLPPRCSYYRR
jgi:hypothetical protein